MVGNVNANLTFPRNVGVGRRSWELGRTEDQRHDREGAGIASMRSQERNFGNTENALVRVQKGAVFLELGEEGVKLLVVFLGRATKDKDVSL